jgi:hypothetical protein
MDVDASPNNSPVRNIGEGPKPQEAEPVAREGEVGIKAAQFVIEKTDIRKHYSFDKLLGTGELSWLGTSRRLRQGVPREESNHGRQVSHQRNRQGAHYQGVQREAA